MGLRALNSLDWYKLHCCCLGRDRAQHPKAQVLQLGSSVREALCAPLSEFFSRWIEGFGRNGAEHVVDSTTARILPNALDLGMVDVRLEQPWAVSADLDRGHASLCPDRNTTLRLYISPNRSTLGPQGCNGTLSPAGLEARALEGGGYFVHGRII